MENSDQQPETDPATLTDVSTDNQTESTDNHTDTSHSTTARGRISVSRRDALASLVGLAGLSLLSSPVQADHGGTHLEGDIDAEGHTLYNLGALEMIATGNRLPTFGTPRGTRTALRGVVNDEQFLHVTPTRTPEAPNIVAGHQSNSSASDIVGATIAGGGKDDGANVWPNEVFVNYGTIGGGANNQAGADTDDPRSARFATVGGGKSNTARGPHAIVGGGRSNTAIASDATIGGGRVNKANGVETTVAGGAGNTASYFGAAVGGGRNNTAREFTTTVSGGFKNLASDGEATVSGGRDNTASGQQATVSGGFRNLASGRQATIGGGGSNTANDAAATVGGGTNNTANVSATIGGGSSNIASSVQATVGGGGDNTANSVQATVGGGRSNTASSCAATVGGGENNTASGARATVPGGLDNTASGDYSFAVGKSAKTEIEPETPDDPPITHDGAVVFADSTSTTFRSQGNNEFRSQMPMYAPSFNTTSARAKKEGIEPVEPGAVLDTVTDLEVNTWQFKDNGESRHMGPMAGEFADAFGLGDDERSIATVDADGVALAAIQGLAEKLAEKDEQLDQKGDQIEDLQVESERKDDWIDELDHENEQLRERLAAVEDRLASLETSLPSTDD